MFCERHLLAQFCNCMSIYSDENGIEKIFWIALKFFWTAKKCRNSSSKKFLIDLEKTYWEYFPNYWEKNLKLIAEHIFFKTIRGKNLIVQGIFLSVIQFPQSFGTVYLTFYNALLRSVFWLSSIKNLSRLTSQVVAILGYYPQYLLRVSVVTILEKVK